MKKFSEEFQKWLTWLTNNLLDGKSLEELGNNFTSVYQDLNWDEREVTLFNMFMVSEYPEVIKIVNTGDDTARKLLAMMMNTWKARAMMALNMEDKLHDFLQNNSTIIDLSDDMNFDRVLSIMNHLKGAMQNIRENNPDLSDMEVKKATMEYVGYLKKKYEV